VLIGVSIMIIDSDLETQSQLWASNAACTGNINRGKRGKRGSLMPRLIPD
jgi:hypothetical protein